MDIVNECILKELPKLRTVQCPILDYIDEITELKDCVIGEIYMVKFSHIEDGNDEPFRAKLIEIYEELRFGLVGGLEQINVYAFTKV